MHKKTIKKEVKKQIYILAFKATKTAPALYIKLEDTEKFNKAFMK